MNKIAFVFPGQGSQSLGMLSDLSKDYPIIIDLYNQASEVLGFDLLDIVQNNNEKLNQTEYTQPALLTASYAIFKIIEQKYPTLKASFFAGHSLGEYSALLCAKTFDFKDAVKLVQIRGQKMQEAMPVGGAMYAILGLDDDIVISACQSVKIGVVSAVNFNSDGQIVIAGEKEAVEEAAIICKEKGAKRCLPLSVSIPSHCSLMSSAADYLKNYLNTINVSMPNTNVLHNYDLSISTNEDEIKYALVSQLYSPVLWKQLVNELHNKGVTKLVEIGPGKVLSGLTPRINTNIKSISVNDLKSLELLSDFVQQ